MDGREGKEFHRFRGSGGSNQTGGGFQFPPPGFKIQSNPRLAASIGFLGSNVGSANQGTGGWFQVPPPALNPHHSNPPSPPPPGFPPGFNLDGGSGGGGAASSHTISATRSGNESIAIKKRGRPRKYATPDGSHMALGLTPAPADATPDPTTPTPQTKRGRSWGSGWKEQLANVAGAPLEETDQEQAPENPSSNEETVCDQAPENPSFDKKIVQKLEPESPSFDEKIVQKIKPENQSFDEKIVQKPEPENPSFDAKIVHKLEPENLSFDEKIVHKLVSNEEYVPEHLDLTKLKPPSRSDGFRTGKEHLEVLKRGSLLLISDIKKAVDAHKMIDLSSKAFTYFDSIRVDYMPVYKAVCSVIRRHSDKEALSKQKPHLAFDTKDLHDQAASEFSKAKERYSGVNRQLEDTQHDFDAVTAHLNHLYAEIKKVVEEKAKLQAKVTVAQAEKVNIDDTYSKAKSKLEKLAPKMSKAQKAVDDYEKQWKENMDALNRSMEELSSLQQLL